MLCRDSVQVSLKLSHPEALFLWEPSRAFHNPYTSNPYVQRRYDVNQVWVTAEMGNCIASDTLKLWNRSYARILGQESSCDTVRLTGPYGADRYWWNTGETTREIIADTPGIYRLAVQDGQCHDTVSRGIYTTKTPKPSIKAKGYCLGDKLHVVLPESHQSWPLEWHNGSDANTLEIADSGWVWVQALATGPGCEEYDSFYVSPDRMVSKALRDTHMCDGDTVVLNAQNPQNNYLWNNGSIEQTLPVWQEGNYYVTISSDSCEVRDTAHVQVSVLEPNIIDTTWLCDSTGVEITGLSADHKHLWSNASTDTFSRYIEAGQQWLTVTKAPCSATDSFYVSDRLLALPLLGNDTNLCQPFSLMLQASEEATRYEWQGLRGQTRKGRHFRADEPGDYYLEAEVQGCVLRDSISIMDTCFYGLYVPNAFTPGNDHINEGFRAKGENIQEFEMKIFNRWGERVFESHSLEEEWDGTFKGHESPMGVYVYIIRYKTAATGWHGVQGNVTLVR